MGKPTFYTGLICNIYMGGQLGTRRTDYCALRVNRDYGNILVRHQSFLRHGKQMFENVVARISGACLHHWQ